MIVVCPVNGLMYGYDDDEGEYNADHPDAKVIECGKCWIALHSDGKGAFVTGDGETFAGHCELHGPWGRGLAGANVILVKLEDGTKTWLHPTGRGGWETPRQTLTETQ